MDVCVFYGLNLGIHLLLVENSYADMLRGSDQTFLVQICLFLGENHLTNKSSQSRSAIDYGMRSISCIS